MRQPYVVGVFLADIHLSSKRPACRASDEEWFGVMEGYFGQVMNIAHRRTDIGDGKILDQKVPIICAGDVFDKWNSSPELINFALQYMPKMWSIPGQHDLPYHRYEDRKKSAYWTLVEAGRIVDLNAVHTISPDVRIHAFPYGFEITPLETPHDLVIDVALVHKYIWRKGACYPDAPPELRLASQYKILKGYDVAFYGDNHIPFDHEPEEGCKVYNIGSLMRRKIDQLNHRPSVCLLYSDKSVKRHYLDVSKDKFIDVKDLIGEDPESDDGKMSAFVDDLLTLVDTAVNFSEALSKVVDKKDISPEVARVILTALERAKEGK